MFLVCLVLFATVTNSSYSSYQGAVGALYTFTESVSSIAETALSSLVSTTEWLQVSKKLGDLAEGERCIISIKIKGEFYNFVCTAHNTIHWDVFYLKIEVALDGYQGWEGKKLSNLGGWIKCPDWGIRVYKVYQYQGE